MIEKGYPIVIEACDNGFLVTARTSGGEAFFLCQAKVFNELGVGLTAGDEGRETLLSWLQNHFEKQA